MSGTHHVVMGDRGRLVVPAGVRERMHLEAGTPLILLESEQGLVVLTREQAKDVLRARLEGSALVAELVDDRRRAAAAEDVA